jgi:elongator complex protein 1
VALKLTPLRLANIPPPMAMHLLTLERKAIDVAISESGSRLAVLSDVDLAVYVLDMQKRPVPKPVLQWRSDAFTDYYPRHVTFIGDEELCVLTDRWDENESCIWRTSGERLQLQGPVFESESISSLGSNVDHRSIYVQFQNGALHRLDEVEASDISPPTTSPIHKFPSLAPEVRVVLVEGQVC